MCKTKSFKQIIQFCVVFMMISFCFASSAAAEQPLSTEVFQQKLNTINQMRDTDAAIDTLLHLDIMICNTPKEIELVYLRYHDNISSDRVRCVHTEIVGERIALGEKCFLDIVSELKEEEVRKIITTYIYTTSSCGFDRSDILWDLNKLKKLKKYKKFFKILKEFQ